MRRHISPVAQKENSSLNRGSFFLCRNTNLCANLFRGNGITAPRGRSVLTPSLPSAPAGHTRHRLRSSFARAKPACPSSCISPCVAGVWGEPQKGGGHAGFASAASSSEKLSKIKSTCAISHTSLSSVFAAARGAPVPTFGGSSKVRSLHTITSHRPAPSPVGGSRCLLGACVRSLRDFD